VPEVAEVVGSCLSRAVVRCPVPSWPKKRVAEAAESWLVLAEAVELARAGALAEQPSAGPGRWGCSSVG